MKKAKVKENALNASFKRLSPKIVYTILIDFFSVSLVILVINGMNMLLKHLETIWTKDIPENIWQLTEQQLQELSAQLPLYYLLTIVVIIFAVLLSILLFSLSRAIIWKISVNERMGLKYALKSLLLGLLWYMIGIIPYLALVLTFKPGIVNQELIPLLWFTPKSEVIGGITPIILYILVFAYFSIVMYINYVKTMKLKSVIDAINEGVKRWDLMLAFLLLCAAYYIIAQGLYMLIIATHIIGVIIALLISFFYFAWSRLYLIEIHKKRG
jgi:hypothetical protein